MFLISYFAVFCPIEVHSKIKNCHLYRDALKLVFFPHTMYSLRQDRPIYRPNFQSL